MSEPVIMRVTHGDEVLYDGPVDWDYNDADENQIYVSAYVRKPEEL